MIPAADTDKPLTAGKCDICHEIRPMYVLDQYTLCYWCRKEMLHKLERER